MNILARLDAYILWWYEIVANWFQKKTSKTCFWVARASVHAAAITFLLHTALIIRARLSSGGLSFSITGLPTFWALVWMILLYSLLNQAQRYEDELFTGKLNGNPERANWGIRITAVFFVPLDLLKVITTSLFDDVLSMLFWLLYTSALYFMACTPLPPRREYHCDRRVAPSTA